MVPSGNGSAGLTNNNGSAALGVNVRASCAVGNSINVLIGASVSIAILLIAMFPAAGGVVISGGGPAANNSSFHIGDVLHVSTMVGGGANGMPSVIDSLE